MRQSEKEITDRAEIDSIIRGSQVCRLGMSEAGQPYVVPLCFGYDGTVLYLHSATAGRKLEILRKNPRVCVEFDTGGTLVEAEDACSWGMKYRSAIAFGTATIVETPAEKKEGLRLLMAQYSAAGRSFSFPDTVLSRTAVIKVEIHRVTGRRSA